MLNEINLSALRRVHLSADKLIQQTARSGGRASDRPVVSSASRSSEAIVAVQQIAEPAEHRSLAMRAAALRRGGQHAPG